MNIPEKAIRFSPLIPTWIERINAVLSRHRYAILPPDYLDFLSQTNGLVFEDLEFYGLEKQHIKHRFFSFPDIVEYNQKMTDDAFMLSKLILGQDSQSLFVYDEKTCSYLVCDRISLQIIESFAGFKELTQRILVDD